MAKKGCSMRKYGKFLAAVAVLVALACGAMGLCVTVTSLPGVQSQRSERCYAPAYKLAGQASMDRWLSAHYPALDVPKTKDATYMQSALSPIVDDLESIRADAAALVVPDCAEQAQRLMLSYFDTELDAYAAYMQGDVAKGDRLYRKAGDIGTEWTEALQALSPSPGEWYEP